ncbi:uncharacterized protein MYCFIDRAFT_178372 [Pseudocercospora fijiensis CIRAD86]|uniref:Uncharacterized protein n=1 Tax=Pseudocercospora fijiensis (strain CIRAD86) TaxID=383855 RepID=M3AQY6_PSEFD|nr:uncharacterized protein MYCFIDRAFT_178372 [Pseudocercospora fijiensis CIRAD86]EME79832.1 hypothetical protein MYCFIDRAFT_178372 [Pseudocercospora fijiensis CIRAD86]
MGIMHMTAGRAGFLLCITQVSPPILNNQKSRFIFTHRLIIEFKWVTSQRCAALVSHQRPSHLRLEDTLRFLREHTSIHHYQVARSLAQTTFIFIFIFTFTFKSIRRNFSGKKKMKCHTYLASKWNVLSIHVCIHTPLPPHNLSTHSFVHWFSYQRGYQSTTQPLSRKKKSH